MTRTFKSLRSHLQHDNKITQWTSLQAICLKTFIVDNLWVRIKFNSFLPYLEISLLFKKIKKVPKSWTRTKQYLSFLSNETFWRNIVYGVRAHLYGTLGRILSYQVQRKKLSALLEEDQVICQNLPASCCFRPHMSKYGLLLIKELQPKQANKTVKRASKPRITLINRISCQYYFTRILRKWATFSYAI